MRKVEPGVVTTPKNGSLPAPEKILFVVVVVGVSYRLTRVADHNITVLFWKTSSIHAHL